MPACARAHKALIVFIIYGVDEPSLIPPALPARYMPMPSSLKNIASGSTHSVSSKSIGPRVDCEAYSYLVPVIKNRKKTKGPKKVYAGERHWPDDGFAT